MGNLRCFGVIAVFAAVCTSFGREENVLRRRLYTVGTTVKNVIFEVVGDADGRKGAANRFQTWVGLKGKRNSIIEPARRGAIMAFMVPWMWWRGSTWRRWSWGVYFQAVTREEDCAVITDWGRRTPFCILSVVYSELNELKRLTGRFVVPDVYNIIPPFPS